MSSSSPRCFSRSTSLALPPTISAIVVHLEAVGTGTEDLFGGDPTVRMINDVLDELSPEYPEVEVDKQHIDAISMNFVRMPEVFDIVVASNLFVSAAIHLGRSVSGAGCAMTDAWCGRATF